MSDPLDILREELARPLEYARVPLCPEISLWLLSDEVDTDATCAELADLERPPYWAFCWIGGQVLARYLIDHPEEVRGLCVVDFGAGSGIAGIAAAQAGARRVTAVDTDPVALQAVRVNAERNGVAVETASSVPEHWDVLLAADMLYDEIARRALRDLAQGKTARLLVSDPGRAPEHAVEKLGRAAGLIARIEARTYPDVDGPKRIASIYALGPAPRVARTSQAAAGARIPSALSK